LKALILAAGRGERMRPPTERTPKPLLTVGGRPLIEWHIEKLVRAGFGTIAVNHSHLGHMIEAALGDGSRLGATLVYSREETPLETAGGIATALPLLDAPCFAVINADVFTDFDYGRLVPVVEDLRLGDDRAHLVLVDNPEHHPHGDFALAGGRVLSDGGSRFTFSGIAVYRRELFADVARDVPAKLAPLLYACVGARKASGEHHVGRWIDVGTPERLEAANRLSRPVL
jgi:N-acetyl-alpha-D-muramate 1-phosphate uridylyltransferase